MIKPSDDILICGAHGMVGSAMCYALRSAGFNRLITPTRREVDWRDDLATRRVMYQNPHVCPDVVIIAAARVGGIQDNDASPVEFLLANLQIEMNIIKAALASPYVRKLMFFGSSCIYPKRAAQPIVESELLTGPLERTNEAYALAKIAGV